MRPDKKKKSQRQKPSAATTTKHEEKFDDDSPQNSGGIPVVSEAVAKGQRENRHRDRRREKTDSKNVQQENSSSLAKQANPAKEEEKKEVNEPENDAERFSHLRRETETYSTRKNYSKRQIFSNWEKYEEPKVVSDDEDETSRGANFFELLQAPISQGGHFTFKSEKLWEDSPSVLYSEYFSLDLNLLSEGLACIPFHKRLNLPEEYFTQGEFEKMNELANLNTKNYKPVIKSVENKLKERQEADKINDKMIDILSFKDERCDDENNSMDSEHTVLTAGATLTLEIDSEPDEEASGNDFQLTNYQNLENLKKLTVEVPKQTASTSEKPNVPMNNTPEKCDSNIYVPIDAKVSKKETTTDTSVTSKHQIESSKDRKKLVSEVQSKDVSLSEGQSKKNLENGDEDLDFLLSLKSPVTEKPFVPSDNVKGSIEDDIKEGKPVKPLSDIVIHEAKPKDLEDWLDGILDD